MLSSAIMRTQESKAEGFFYIGLAELCTAPVVFAIALPRPRWQRRHEQLQGRAAAAALAAQGQPGGTVH